MFKRKKHLTELALCDNATILDIIDKSEIIKQPRVVFICFCGAQYSKQVNDVCGKKSTGLFCHIHSLERKRRLKIRNAIEESAKRDSATYDESDIHWGKDACLIFTCFCGVKNTKTFSGICKNQGMFCKEHTIEKTREKAKNTSILNYGTCHPQKSKKLKEQIRNNCMLKYGVEYLAHVPEIHTKQHKYKFKDYIMPSGKICKIQGYENLAIDELLKEHPESVISTTRFGIKYTFEDQEHYYYPDIVLEYEQPKIIEVKSTHTMYYKYHYLRNLAKRESCLKQGYAFEFWIYDKKKIKTII